MSILKGLILIVFFAILLYKIFLLKKEKAKQYEYFIKTLSHDFRVATLAQLRGLELLSKSCDFDLHQMELFSEINNSCLYSLDMISMLQKTYLFENGEQVINYVNFSLQELFESVFTSIKEQVVEKNISLIYEFDKTIEISADKEMISKLIFNIITTALSYAESNSNILLISNKKNGIWKFTVTYQGKSLSQEECNRMFSTNTYFSTVGHGIKMYLSKKIVDFHKGKINVKNISKKLNSFTFQIMQEKEKQVAKMPVLMRLQVD